MNVYVSGSIHDMERVQSVQRIFTENGHHITFDWTCAPAKASWNKHQTEARTLASAMRVGVQTASLLVVIHPPIGVKAQGTWIEMGIALAQGTPVWIIDPLSYGPFLYSPRVVKFGMDELHERIMV